MATEPVSQLVDNPGKFVLLVGRHQPCFHSESADLIRIGEIRRIHEFFKSRYPRPGVGVESTPVELGEPVVASKESMRDGYVLSARMRKHKCSARP